MTRRWPIILALLLAGCATSAYHAHPGAAGYITGTPTPVQLFASQSYDTLVAADSVITQTRADFLAGKFTAAQMPTVRTAFNVLVSSYDTAQASWIAFNTQATANPSISQAALAAALAGVNTAITNLATAKGVTP